VSNLAVASFVTAQPEMPLVERIDCTDARQKAAARAAQRTRLRQRALDRSRRNTNAAQYGPSMRRHKRAERHTAKGLPAKQIANPGGARHARTDGVPLRAYRHDELSQRHQRTRCDHAAESRHTSQAKQAAPARSLRRSWPPTATRSPSRAAASLPGRSCGANGSPCSAPACSWPLWPPNAKSAAGSLSRRHPVHRDEPALPLRRAGAQDAGATHPPLSALRTAREPRHHFRATGGLRECHRPRNCQNPNERPIISFIISVVPP
jgi:hypothetical protein